MIHVDKLNKSIDNFHILKDLTLTVKSGSIYGLVGPNGCGKTTLIKHLTGILQRDSGRIEFDGSDIYENTEIKANLGFIPDDLSFYDAYSLEDAADYYKHVYPVFDEERFRQMKSDFEIDRAGKIRGFSKGMKKQAAFALMMCTHPKYIVLDEPIDGLDPIIRKMVWKYIIEDVSGAGASVLVSSHNLREMEGICDSIGIMSDGTMRLERDLDELKSDIHKVQVAFPDVKHSEERYAGLNVLSRETRGSVDLLIIRNDKETVRSMINAQSPLLFDILPLSLEEIFICELGGEHYEIRDILF